MSELKVEVQKITRVTTLNHADNLEMIQVLGWECLTRKGDFKVGDSCIFIPPDSVVPDKLKEELGLKDNRIKTIKLRGYISQGLVLSVRRLKNPKSRIGTDVAKELGIVKYTNVKKSKQPETSNWNKLISGKMSFRRFIAKTTIDICNYLKPKRSGNPLFKKYTDINNFKHYPYVFQPGEAVIFSEKIHGTSSRYARLPKKQHSLLARFFKPTYEYVYGSHNVQKTLGNNSGFYKNDVYAEIGKKYNFKNIIPEDYAIYGEIYGNNNGHAIQKGFDYGVTGLAFAAFDVKYKDQYLNYEDFKKFCDERNIPTVKILYRGPYSESEVNKHADGPTTMFSGSKVHIREGLVIRPEKESISKCGRKVLKVISKDYSLLQEKTKSFENTEFEH